MTVPAQTRRSSVYNGNDSTTSFPFTFKALSDEDIRVVVADVDGVESDITLGVDFTVTLNADQDASPGGSVEYPISGGPLATGEKLVVIGGMEVSQGTDLTNFGFYPTSIETMGDRIVMMLQEVLTDVSRSARRAYTDETAAAPLLPTPAAGFVLGWDADGNVVNLSGVSGTAVTSYMATVLAASNASAARSSLGLVDPTVINVRDPAYGATGDGATDDTAAIQAAINAAGDSTVIYLPKGNYRVGALTVTGKNEITLVGDGYRATWLTLKNGANADLLTFGNGSSYLAGFKVVGLRLNGNSANNTSGSGIKFYSTEDNSVVECYISDFKDHGILFEGTGSRNATYAKITGSYVVNNSQHGVYAKNQAYGAMVSGNVIAGNGKAPAGGFGFLASTNDGHIILGNVFDENSHSVGLYGVSDSTVSGNFLQNQDRHGVLIYGASIGNLVYGNMIYNPSSSPANTYAGVLLGDSTYNQVHGNFIWARTVAASDGVRETGTSDYNSVEHNNIVGTFTNPVLMVGANTKVHSNGSQDSSHVRAHNNGSNQSVPSDSSWVTLQFTTEAVDSLNEFNGTTFTAKVSGLYLFSVNVTYVTLAADSPIYAGLFKNGSQEAITSKYASAGASFNDMVTLVAPIKLSAGDAITIRTKVEGGAPATVDGAAAQSWISITRLQG